MASFLLSLVTNCWVLDPSLPLLSFSIALLPTLGVKLAELACLWNLDDTQRLNAFTAYCLGLVFLCGLYLQSSFGIYLCFLAFFHFSEYVATGLGNPRNLSFDSYLVSHCLFQHIISCFLSLHKPIPMQVNHSVQYGVAMVVSWTEHALWLSFFPSLKSLYLVTILGIVLCLVGEVVRKAAMLEAGRSFNHLVQSERADDHTLVTSGIYSWCR